MKTAITCALAALLLAGCDVAPVKDGMKDMQSGKIYADAGKFAYVRVDGHEYLVWTYGDLGGLTHSPECPCLGSKIQKRRKSEEISY